MPTDGRAIRGLESLRDFDRRIADALEEQRRQIGLELHDGVGQLLTAIRIRSQSLVELAASDALREECLRLAEEAEQALALLRSISIELSPAGLVRGDTLRRALEMLAESTRNLGFDCQFSWSGGVRFAEASARAHAFRIVQEALNNAVKHAAARSIRIVGRTDADAFVLVVADDGIGFDVDRETYTLGLQSRRHRARSLGAALTIESRIGTGTTVTCRIPLGLDRPAQDAWRAPV